MIPGNTIYYEMAADSYHNGGNGVPIVMRGRDSTGSGLCPFTDLLQPGRFLLAKVL